MNDLKILKGGESWRMLLSTVLFLWVLLSQNLYAATAPKVDGVSYENPGAQLWRDIRQRDGNVQGTTQIKGMDSNVWMNVSGEAWRQYRMLSLIPRAGIAILATLIAVILFRLIRGQIKIQAGRSSKKILRFTLNQRVVHWVAAVLFIILAVTGIVLLFGRGLLIPLLGKEAFSMIAAASKLLHDYLGPAFAVSLLILFALFVKGNLPSLKTDIGWFLRGGGMFGKHASADRYNAGEKGWFWLVVLVGGVIVVSGFVLDFPILQQNRSGLEFYHWLHTIAASVIIIASIGHIYIGSVGTEGALETMKTGYCDANWAKEHHDLWYQKVADTAVDESELEQPAKAAEPAVKKASV